MSAVQTAFRKFHENIKLGWDEEQGILREKRDIVLEKLRAGLKKQFEEKDEKPPTFSTYNQGSYAMAVGIKPTDEDYDIDVAILFNISIVDYPDPVVVKRWVHDALEGHTQDVPFMRPCVRVQYQSGDQKLYHLDLAIYSDQGSNADGKTYLAMGYSGSSTENREWKDSDPKALVDAIRGKHDGQDAEQFRRVIKYLKRWKDLKFPSKGEAAPRGISLACAAYSWFSAVQETVDFVSGKTEYDDLKATLGLVQQMVARFIPAVEDGQQVVRLKTPLPIAPYDDPGERMSGKQMMAFKSKLEALRDVLIEARDEVDPVEACTNLRDNAFGDDFPVPEPPKTAKKVGPSVLTSQDSA